MKIKMHRPGFVEAETPPATYEFNTLEELLAIPAIKDLNDAPFFQRWSISVDGPAEWNDRPAQHHLMIELKDGSFYVIGFLSDDALQLDLPRWILPSQRKA